MSRFLIVRVSQEKVSLAEVAERAKQALLVQDADRGFEVDTLTRQRLVLKWFEKVVVERKIITGMFSGISFTEVKIVSFGFIIDGSASRVIIVDPPLSKGRLHKVLRILFHRANFIHGRLDLMATLSVLSSKTSARVCAVETEPLATPLGVKVAMKVVGDDALDYLQTEYTGRFQQVRSACIELHNEGETKLVMSLSNGGVARVVGGATYSEIEGLADLLVLSEG